MGATDADSPKRFSLLLSMLCVLLGVASVMYWWKGLDYLVILPAKIWDYRERWVDMRYIFAGRNPYDVFFATPLGAYARRPMWNERSTALLPGIGAPLNAGYPPWAFFAGAIFCWPSWPAARLYFALINVIAGGLTFGWAYGLGRAHGKLAGLVLGLSFTACSANSTTLEVGQYSIIITALLIGSMYLMERHRGGVSGVMLGLALTKPITSGPFCLLMLFGRKWKIMAAVALYLVVADGVIWWVTRTNPIEMVLQMLHAAQGYMDQGYGPLSVLLYMGVPVARAMALTAVSVLGVGAVLMWMWRNAPILVQFAIASVTGRLWTYHHLYDNGMVLFLLIAVGEAAFRLRKPGHFVVFLLVGATLWAPGKACDHLAFQIFQMVVWVGGTGFILANTARGGNEGNAFLPQKETDGLSAARPL